MALLPQPSSEANRPLELKDALHVLATGTYADDPALHLVVADAIRAETAEQAKAWVMAWPQSSILYQSPVSTKYWEGSSGVERANVPMFTVATMVRSLVPQIMNGLFYENPPFQIEPRPKTTKQAARAIGAVITYQLEDIDFRQELEYGINNSLIFGTGIWKWGWETYTKERKVYQRKNAPIVVKGQPGMEDIKIPETDDDIEEVIRTEYIDRPTFEHIVNLRHILVDPGLNVPDIRKGKFVIHRRYVTFHDLDKLRNRPGFTIPPQAELLALFFPPAEVPDAAPSETAAQNPNWDARAEPRYKETTEDPFSKPLEILERWDNEKYIVVLQKKLVICNDENPYGEIPFLSIGWWDVPEAFWSMGLGKTIGPEQRLQQGVTNSWLDNIALNLQGVFTRVRGKNIPTQPIRISPGKIIDVDEKDAMKPLTRTDAVPEAGSMLQASQARAEQVSGANELITQGSLGGGGRSSITRTAAGVNALSSGTSIRIQDFVEKLAYQVIIPFLYNVQKMNAAMLPLTTLKSILSEELQQAYEGDVLDLLNARVHFNISAASRLQARRNMAQALPIIIQFTMSQQIIQSLAVEGKKVNATEIMRMLFEVSDWKNNKEVIVNMTEEDKQRFFAMQPGAAKAMELQAKSQLQDKAHEQKKEIVDEENTARAARQVLQESLKQRAEQPLSGIPEQAISVPPVPVTNLVGA